MILHVSPPTITNLVTDPPATINVTGNLDFGNGTNIKLGPAYAANGWYNLFNVSGSVVNGANASVQFDTSLVSNYWVRKIRYPASGPGYFSVLVTKIVT